MSIAKLDRRKSRYVTNRARCVLRLAALGAAVVTALAVSDPAYAVLVPDKPTVTAAPNGPIQAIAFSGNTVYLGGAFTSVVDGGTTYPRNRLAAIDATTGHLLPWNPNASNIVRAVAVAGGAVYVAGDFNRVGGLTRVNIAKVDAVTGAVATNFVHQLDARGRALTTGNGMLYVGGDFITVDGTVRNRLAAFSLSTNALVAGWQPVANDLVRGLTFAHNRVYAVGAFTRLNNSTARQHLGAVNPTTGALDNSFNAILRIDSHAIATSPTAVYVASDGSGGHLRAYGLTGTDQFELTADGGFQGVAVLDDTLYLGGHFDHVCSTARTGANGTCLDGSVQRKKLAAVSVTGGALLPWTPNANSALGVYALVSDPATRRLAAGGEFTNFKFGAVVQAHFALFT